MRARDEAILERHVLAALGQVPDLALYTNETGQGFAGSLEPALLDAFPEEPATVRRILNRHRIRWGLGNGSPDLVGAIAGRFLGLELKAPRGMVAADQVQWHEAARAKGGAVFVVRSVPEALAAIDRARAGGLR